MALETLKKVKEIGGYTLHENEWKSGGTRFVEVNHADNAITFKIQDGPIKENGVNGCQVDTMIEAAKVIIEGLDKQFPSEYNKNAIMKLQESLMWLRQRKIDREARGVEGYSKA